MPFMQAMITRQYGPDAIFEESTVKRPVPGHGQVLIQVKASSLNPVDNLLLRSDLGFNPELPAILHGDVAGIVCQVGEGVRHLYEGDEVYGCCGGFASLSGALAEYMLADIRLIALKPKSLDFASAAALPLVTATAWEALVDHAGLQGGEHALIHAGRGGVGHIAIQLAKIMGARVATTISRQEDAEIMYNLGVDEVIFYPDESVHSYVKRLTNGRGFDLVFDSVGGQNLELSFEATRAKGRVVNIWPGDCRSLFSAFKQGVTLHMVNMSLPMVTGIGRESQGEIYREAARLVNEGRLKALIHEKTYRFDQINEAHALYERKEHRGKVVLISHWH